MFYQHKQKNFNTYIMATKIINTENIDLSKLTDKSLLVRHAFEDAIDEFDTTTKTVEYCANALSSNNIAAWERKEYQSTQSEYREANRKAKEHLSFLLSIHPEVLIK